MEAAGYEDCETGVTNTEGADGPFTFNGEKAGTYYFVCGKVGGHCKYGKQKAKITVKADCR